MNKYLVKLSDIHGNNVDFSIYVMAVNENEAENMAMSEAGNCHPLNSFGVVSIEVVE